MRKYLHRRRNRGGGWGGGAGGSSTPTIFYLGGQCPHTILVANGTIRRNAHTQPPVRSIIIHVDMIFCVKGTGRDSKGWSTIEFEMIDTVALRASTRLNTRDFRTAPPVVCARMLIGAPTIRGPHIIHFFLPIILLANSTFSPYYSLEVCPLFLPNSHHVARDGPIYRTLRERQIRVRALRYCACNSAYA